MTRAIKVLALGAAASLLAAGLAVACEGHAKAKNTVAKSGCSKTQATSTASCSKSATTTTATSTTTQAGATATLTSSTGCAHAAKAQQTAGAGCAKAQQASASGCAKAKGASMASAGCCAKSTGAVTTFAGTACPHLKAGKVALRGTIHCAHCDLHVADDCATVIRTAEGCLFNVKGDKVDSLREQAGHGSKLVRVRGTLSPSGEISLASYRVIGAAPAPAASAM